MSNPTPSSRPRLESVDLLRGLVIALMALDHVRDFVSPVFVGSAATLPEDLPSLEPAVFLTRWVTHFCAPVFLLLAGTSAYLYRDARGLSRGQLSRFLLTRGLWLVFLELTLVTALWLFLPPIVSVVFIQVIWAIGISMILLAVLVHLPRPWLLVIVAIAIGGHNLLDGLPLEARIAAAAPGAFDAGMQLWALLHHKAFFFGPPFVMIIYPIVPWFAVMALGYALGPVMKAPTPSRRRILLTLGGGATAAFVALRALGVYGDPRPWVTDEGLVTAVLTFLSCEKYPPSLLFLLMTLGPALILLALLGGRGGEGARETGRPGGLPLPAGLERSLLTFGRVPLFFYVVHLPLANLLGAFFFQIRWDQSRWIAGLTLPPPEGYSPNFLATYGAWVVCLLLMLPLCRRFGAWKRRQRSWWVGYL